MSASKALLGAFEQARARIPRLGVDEYVALLRALEAGFGGSRTELVALCQALWARTPREQRQVADAVASTLVAAGPEEPQMEPSVGPPASQPEAGAEPPAQAPQPRTPRSAGAAGVEAVVTPPVAAADHAAGGGTPLPAAVGTLPAVAYDLEANLPVSPRQMSRAWQRFRRMGRAGAPVEVDADATLREIYRSGVRTLPVLVPRRTNQARVLILHDVGGSMVPFRYLSQELVHAARQAGLARVDVFHFHDVAGEVVFRDPALLAPVPLDEALTFFAEAGVLVYSDAGAARGGTDVARVARTGAMLWRVRRFTSRVAWLNPVPRERWGASTAWQIIERCGVAMFPLDRPGLEAAITRLRGDA